MAQNDIIKVSLVFNDTQFGLSLAPRFHLIQTSSGATDFEAIAENMRLWWDTTGGTFTGERTRTSSGISFVTIALQKVAPLPQGSTTETPYLAGLHSSATGAITGDALPPQNARLLSFRTGLGGRANRGRLFLPKTGESQSDAGGNLVNADALAAAGRWTNAMNSYATGVGVPAIQYQQVIFHKTTLTSTVVTTVRADRRQRVQRRRQPSTPLYAS